MMNRRTVSARQSPPAQASLDYKRIERAIRFLSAHFLERPSLAAVAQAVHLSEFHFQRLFTRWAGTSPKRFLQMLTLQHAKAQLSAAKPLLDTALDSGLSGPGRLHDLFVTIEAVSPGEFRTRGKGIRISYGFHPSPFGRVLLGATPRGICWLSFVNAGGDRRALREMRQHWIGAAFQADPDGTARLAARIFPMHRRRGVPALSALVMGTNFQVKVWQALMQIAPGRVVSYETIAKRVGAERAAHAIGGAVARNRVACLVPCHRVIRKSGVLGGYRWGTDRKRALLAWEAGRSYGS
jgi:AraC family transcriptional regulator of adaptative response/methylated-DNA-[protein]-cysteine methyltransferase